MTVSLVAALAPLTLMSCGDDGAPVSPDDEIAREIAGVAELAANAYASVGPEGLYDYLSPTVTRRCSKETLVEALKDEPVPDGFKRVENVLIDRHTVLADVVQRFGEEEKAVAWQFVPEPPTPIEGATGSWRVISLPGLERCRD